MTIGTPTPVRSRALGALLVAIVIAHGAAFGDTPASEPRPIFRFETDGFWLNLHHYLYVLGRAEAGMPDIERRAVAQAPADQERGLETLSPDDRRIWRDAVSAYSRGPSRLDAVFDEKLASATGNLVGVGPDGPLDGVEIDATWAAALRQAAPIYRRVWWPEHEAANRAWVAATETLLARHGRPVLAFVTRVTGLPWPVDGYPIQVSGYCNWAGAYSTRGNLLVLSSLDTALRGTTVGLEIVFHEAMHQFDDANDAALEAAAKALDVRLPRGLDHAMLFFTAGEAFRTVIPEHVPYAVQYGIWERSSGRFLPALEAAWRPYLHGVVPRDRALADLLRHVSSAPE